MLNLALVIVVTRALDKNAAGAVFAVTSVFLLVETVVRLGTDAGVVHFVAKSQVAERSAVAQVIAASFVPLLPAMIIGGVVVGFLTPVVVHSLGPDAGISHVDLVSLVLAFMVPIAATYDFMTAATRGLGANKPTVVIERIMRPLLQGAAVTALAVTTDSAAAVSIAWIAPYAVGFVLMFGSLRRRLRANGHHLRLADWRIRFREVWSWTLPRSITGMLQILLQRLDIIIVGAILGAPAAAIYTGATRFVVVGQLGNQAISYVFQPQLAGLVGAGKLKEARELYRVSTAWIVGLNAPLYLAVCTTSPLLVKLLGSRYHAGLGTMVIITAFSLVGTCCGLVDFVIITMGRTSWNLINTTIALAVNLAIDLIFIPDHGIKAAAFGWGAAILINNFLPLAQVNRAFQFNPVSRVWVVMLVVSGVLFGALPGVTLATVGASLPAMVGVLAVATAVYLAVLWRLRESLALSQLLPGGRK
ncbi:MAG: polysaccharide biosynthesis protein [Frankiaceae bacterium]|nr:polysaccharide biosynthesis protein [Frankiaceae bacterium]